MLKYKVEIEKITRVDGSISYRVRDRHYLFGLIRVYHGAVYFNDLGLAKQHKAMLERIYYPKKIERVEVIG